MARRGPLALAVLTVVALLVPAGTARADAQQVWKKTYPGVGNCGLEAVSTAVDTSSGTVYAAYHDFECGPDAPLLVAYSSGGSRKWAVENTSSDDAPAGVAVDPASHTVLLASTRNDSELLIQAFDTSGHKLWGKALVAGGSDNFHTNGLGVDAHGRVVVSGTKTHSGVDTFTTAAFKVSDGSTLWDVHFDGVEALGATAVAIAVDPGQNRAYIVGNAFTGDSENLVTIAYGTATGHVAWTKEVEIARGANAVPTGIAVDPANHQVYSLTGSTSAAETDTYAYASTGAFQWKRTFTGSGVLPEVIAVDKGDHQIYVAATGGPNFRTTLVAYSAAGVQQWTDNDPTADQAFPEDLVADPANGRVYVTSRVTATDSTTHIVTFADSATGTRAWHQVVNATGGQSIEPGALAVDPGRSQLYVTGDESQPVGALLSVAIADHA